MTILDTLAPTIDATGISAPAYPDILESMTEQYQTIFGSDLYVEPDSQDGQDLAIRAQAQNAVNGAIIAAYNAFSPATAQGAGLSSVVKINGLEREIPTNSTDDLILVGVAGAQIVNGLVGDANGNQWALPALVTIPPGGSITETATCTVKGAILAAPDTITKILNPQFQWQSATNVGSATPGAPVEGDATLRTRQSDSTAISAVTPLESIVAYVRNLPGVQAVQPYENDTSTVDANGLPDHSISLVVEGGDVVQIATAIAAKKSPGTGTYGTTSEVVIDQNGVPDTIRFFRPTMVRLTATINLKALPGYTSAIGASVKAAAAAYVSGLPIGAETYLSKVETAANLNNTAPSATFNLQSILLARYPATPAAADVAIAFNEVASLAVSDIVLNVS